MSLTEKMRDVSEELEGLEDFKPEEKRRILRNVLILSLAFMVHFTAFQGAANLQSSVNSSAGLGTASLATIYGALILSNVFLPVVMIRYVFLSVVMIRYLPTSNAGTRGFSAPGTPLPSVETLTVATINALRPTHCDQSEYYSQLALYQLLPLVTLKGELSFKEGGVKILPAVLYNLWDVGREHSLVMAAFFICYK
uniref:Uncharacterized protein n=1 Tax=Timema poppense TaxID=170557 RepID=A0A7R9D1G2_TIMPO|nr:unnamed protein product [Timema poppensis]